MFEVEVCECGKHVLVIYEYKEVKGVNKRVKETLCEMTPIETEHNVLFEKHVCPAKEEMVPTPVRELNETRRDVKIGNMYWLE